MIILAHCSKVTCHAVLTYLARFLARSFKLFTSMPRPVCILKIDNSCDVSVTSLKRIYHKKCIDSNKLLRTAGVCGLRSPYACVRHTCTV